MKKKLILLLPAILFSKFALATSLPGVGVIETFTGLEFNMTLDPSTAAKNCIGVQISAPRGRLEYIKKLRTNKFFNDQGEAFCLAMKTVCKRCTPVVVLEIEP